MPFNLILKNLILTTFSFSCLGIIIPNYKFFKIRLNGIVWLVSLLFVVCMLSTFLFSGAPKDQQFWGTFGRGTGVLTYFSLLLVLISTAIIQEKNFYVKLVYGLILTNIPLTFYAIVQTFGLDPIKWSLQDTFATLGNSNFLSAFMGISSTAAFVLATNSRFSKKIRLGLFLLILTNQIIIIDSGSIQGFMIFIAGIGVSGFFLLQNYTEKKTIRIGYYFASFIGALLSIFGLFNKGPLAKIIFQPSVIYRSDYMHAAWEMTILRPLTGVGMDSYGDWYRKTRGVISTLRGIDRTSNTAHNIFLDISSNGGIPLFISYIALIGLAVITSIKYLKRAEKIEIIFIAIFSSWIAYQLQAAISINQIGVGIWGWLLTGALIGFNKSEVNKINSKPLAPSRKNVRKKNALPASTSLLVIAFAVIGFLLAFIPFKADMDFKNALNSRSLNLMISSVNRLGTNSFLISQVIQAAINNGYTAQARELDLKLIKSYPLEPYGWKILYYSTTSSEDEKLLAKTKLKEFDPYNPNNPK